MKSLLDPRHVVARQLGLDPDQIDPERPLASYGMDSLRAMELLAALEDATGRQLPESFCFDHPTLAALAGALEGATAGAKPGASRWEADLGLAGGLDVAPGDPARSPRNIFLTGATGFVGAHLLRTLIDRTDAQVWCLVRATPGEGLARIRANLAQYGLWREPMASRIEIVRGDLGAPNLGLAAAEHHVVATMTDAVVHAAAAVDWVQPYTALRRANVLGTLEVLRLAASARPKPVQFLSSLSVCYVPGGPPAIDEATDCVPYLDRLPLGYAQTKGVGEALCADAARRGLPVRVIRAALVAGDSRTGASNADDLVGRLVRGCIEMGAAPDLDWSLDAVPADELAQAIVGAPWPAARSVERVHLASPRPRTWQECILWINLLGYRCRLLPFDVWRDRLAWAGRRPAHPLAPLRTFFAAGAHRESPAELCQMTRHSRVVVANGATGNAADDRGGPAAHPRGMDAAMLARQIDGYASAGLLQPAGCRRSIHGERPPLWRRPDDLAAILGERLGPGVAVRSVENVSGDPALGIISDLSSWRRGNETGIVRCRLTIEHRGRLTSLPVVIKAKAHDADAMEAARALAAACDDDLAREVARFEQAIGLAGAGDREVALYERASAGLRRVMPACYGTWRQSDEAGAGLILENLGEAAHLDATDPSRWTPADILVAVDGLASMHAAGLDTDLQSLAPTMRRPDDVRRMAPLWSALARHAAGLFERMAGPELVSRHAALVAAVDRWAPAVKASHDTLIHHDFSPRNAALRRSGANRTLVAYDWELATIGLPQRDLAEFLCFVLPADVDAASVARLVERHRQQLERASGRAWPRRDWQEGFRAALWLLLVDRLAFYAMIARVRPQRFLPGVLRTWQRLDAIAASAALQRGAA